MSIKYDSGSGDLRYNLADYSPDASLSTLSIAQVRAEYKRLQKIANMRVGQLRQDASLSHMDAAKARFPALQDIREDHRRGKRGKGKRKPENERLWLAKVAKFVTDTSNLEEKLDRFIANLRSMGFTGASRKNWWLYRDMMDKWRASNPKSESPTQMEKIKMRLAVVHPELTGKKLNELAEKYAGDQAKAEKDLEEWMRKKDASMTEEERGTMKAEKGRAISAEDKLTTEMEKIEGSGEIRITEKQLKDAFKVLRARMAEENEDVAIDKIIEEIKKSIKEDREHPEETIPGYMKDTAKKEEFMKPEDFGIDINNPDEHFWE